MHEYETFGNQNQKLDHDEQCLRRDEALRLGVARLCLGEPEGGPNCPFGLATERQRFAAAKHFAEARVPFTATKGPLMPGFWFFPFLYFFTKKSQNSNQNMGITPKDILKSS